MRVRSNLIRFAFVGGLCTLAALPRLQAQRVGTVDTRIAAGPTRAASVAGVRLAPSSAPLRVTSAAPSSSASGKTLAIVGGAGFLGGLIIGDDAGTAIAIAGLAVGLYGLYLWLK